MKSDILIIYVFLSKIKMFLIKFFISNNNLINIFSKNNFGVLKLF